MWPEFVQWLAFFFIAVGLLKVVAAHNLGNPLGRGLAWFVPGLA